MLNSYKDSTNVSRKILNISKRTKKNNSLVDNETSQDQGELHINLTRNDPCYCKSGKTYKHCHGKIKG